MWWTHPEVSHGVDLHRFLDQGVGGVHELLSRDDACVVHQNGDVPDLSLNLNGARRMGQSPFSKERKGAHICSVFFLLIGL